MTLACEISVTLKAPLLLLLLLFQQGVWKPRKISNPAFFEDLQPFRMSPFSALGLELWSMTSDIFFDNFFITDDRNAADRWAADGWGLKKAAEGAAEVGDATVATPPAGGNWCLRICWFQVASSDKDV